MNKLKFLVAIVFSLAVGFFFGAASIHRPIPNAPLELPPARKPWNPKDVMGLIGSVGIRTLAGHLETVPLVVLETDRTFAITVSASETEAHYVLVPKKDIREIGEISAEDGPYLIDVFLTARQLIEKQGLYDYRIYTNGRGLQSVSYLHFHLVGERGPHE
jgi:diadenosine tetraphosphate (Ap4A) HIT family hydrolase